MYGVRLPAHAPEGGRPAAGRYARVAAALLTASARLRRAPDAPDAVTPARAVVAAPGLVVAVSGLLTARPLPISRP
ncbi:hypothetical protein [Streptomyces gibsoniae]|uniref:Uncharacterized protein n=1 Tax=Streptomyces gibsoniae TaxID=3075529 RepID=A0ABU2U0E9_9ACTN|nr:hypothetical protein [Streptomyces sp. DSM 41699]MDT0466702.1 hypothetical protein [Streptomyces sp. DSM 41699]